MLRIDKVSKVYKSKSVDVTALNNINLELKENTLTFLLGKSGSGKTTLLNILSGLDFPDKGNIIYEGKDIHDMCDKDMDMYRNYNIGIIFQEYNLIESLNVYDNVAIALEIQGFDKKYIHKKVIEVLDYVELSGMDKRKITELSGGQAQRVAIARALVKEPQIIFADEPTGNLDSQTSTQIIKLLKKISQRCLVVVVTHDENFASEYGDMIIEIHDGTISSVSQKESKENTYTISYNTLDGVKKITGLEKGKIGKAIIGIIANNEKINLSINKENTVHIAEKKNISAHCNEDIKKSNLYNGNLRKGTIYRFSLINFIKKPIRTFFVLLLFSLSLFLLMITLHVSNLNYPMVIAKYLETYKLDELYLYKDIDYTNTMYETKKELLTSGGFYLDLVNNISGISLFGITDKLNIEIIDKDINSSNSDTSNIKYVFDNGIVYSEKDLILGELPSKANEVLITDYIADTYFKSESNIIGKEICISDINVIIVGVIKTDYKKYNYAYKKKYGIDREYVTHRMQREYELIVLRDDYLELYKQHNKIIVVEYGNFTMPNKDIKFDDYADVYYGSLKETKEEGLELLAGRIPEVENEILVSNLFYERYMLEIINKDELMTDINMSSLYNDFVEKQYSYVDLYSEKYNHYYTSYINMYNYLNSIKVVGVFDAFSDGLVSNVDVVVTDEVFDKMEQDYIEGMIYSEYGAYIQDTKYHKLVSSLVENDIRINEPSITKIYQFRDTLQSLKPILQILLVVVLGITILVLFSYISFSISISGKQIGILRSIGVTQKDTTFIYVIETAIITMLSLVISFVFDMVLMNYVNMLYIENLVENPYDIIVPNILLCIIVPIVTIIISIISVIVPIHSLKKMKLIEIIRGSKK